jgi:hypothetical protein
MRYLSLLGLPAKDRAEAWKVIAGHLNSLSRAPDLAPLEIVESSELCLARVNLKDFGIAPEVWDRLADPHMWVRGYYEGGHWQDRERYYPAPWLLRTRAAYDAYYELREHAANPITEGTWFLWHTATQEGRGKAGYYDFLDIKDEASFERLIRFNKEMAAQLERRRVVTFSRITKQPRRIELLPTVLGGYYRTLDNALALAARNPLRLLDDSFQHDVTERFAALPNKMVAWYLGDKDGKRADKAPDNIVKYAPLLVNIHCIDCHGAATKHERFIKDIEDTPVVQLRSYDLDQLRVLRRQYQEGIADTVREDRARYAAAVARATDGLSVQDYSVAYVRWYNHHDDEARVDAARLGRVLGYSGAEVVAKLRSYNRRTPYLDAVLSILAGGGALPARQAEEVYHVAYRTLRAEDRR